MKTYKIVRNALQKDVCKFLETYFLEKEKVAKLYLTTEFISRFNKEYGAFNDPQVPGAYSLYGSTAGDIILKQLKPKVEKITKTKLYETYSYMRTYNEGDELKKHKDRTSCKISTTINLGGEIWPIFIQTDPNQGSKNIRDENEQIKNYIPGTKKGDKVILKPGDMLVYRGCELEHWREKFKGKQCIQTFLHYNNRKTPGAKENMFDTRPHLGLPEWFKRK